ncbi:hypothetical protein BaRGS_00003491 [Batillaria attramentaria]|uniref:Uncharacterized protein n=1 Tax=Batillaria attramentaria TaxID=370345 RepID=A0ABD0M1Y3_9CAEN
MAVTVVVSGTGERWNVTHIKVKASTSFTFDAGKTTLAAAGLQQKRCVPKRSNSLVQLPTTYNAGHFGMSTQTNK